MENRQTKAMESPAADAAGLLLRLGFGLLVLATPVAALFSRRAFVVLVPIGALLMVVAALLREPEVLSARIARAIRSPTGLTLVAFTGWAIASLVWTPFPGPASERLFRTIGIALMALTVVAALPERMRASNLHLMTIGVIMATVLLIVASILGAAAPRFLHDPEAPTTGRAAVAAGVMVWAPIAWSLTRGKETHAYLLIALIAVAIAASGSLAAAVVTIFALVVFLCARTNAAATGGVLAGLFGGAVLFAPVLPFLSGAVTRSFRLPRDSVFSDVAAWAEVITGAPARLITGRGFDTALRARLSGIVNPQASGGLVPDVWFDLGIVGAVGLALALALGFLALSRMSQPMAATGLAVTTAILIFTMIDPTATQAWWLSVIAVAVTTLGAVHNGQYRTVRPAAEGAGKPRRPAAPIER